MLNTVESLEYSQMNPISLDVKLIERLPATFPSCDTMIRRSYSLIYLTLPPLFKALMSQTISPGNEHEYAYLCILFLSLDITGENLIICALQNISMKDRGTDA